MQTDCKRLLLSAICFLCLIFPSIVFSETVSDEKLEKVTLQLKWLHQFQFAGYYAAKEKGFYADEGLDVNIIQRDPQSNPIDDVVAGKAEYGISDSGLLLSRLKGNPVVLVAQIFQYSPQVFLTLQESGLRTPFQLANKRVMSDTQGDSDIALMAMMLRSLGKLDKDSWFPHSQNNTDLRNGKVDAMLAYSTVQPFWFHERGIKINIIDPRDYGVDLYGDNLFTLEKEISDNPERVERMKRASIKGWKYALEHQQEIVDLILNKYNPQGFSKKHLLFEAAETKKTINPGFIELGSFVNSRFQKIAGIYTELSIAEEFEVPENFYFLEEMLQPKESDKNKIENDYLFQWLTTALLFLLVSLFVTWLIRGRPKHLSIRDLLLYVSVFMVVLLLIVSVFVSMLLSGEKRIYKIEEIKFNAASLTYELKQSSDDLTRFARLYAATKNPIFKEYFNAVIAMRDGKLAYPKSYGLTYWDQLLASGDVVNHSGAIFSIEQRFSEMGLSADEMAALKTAKVQSDDLIAIEAEAMHAIDIESDFLLAKNLLNSNEYHVAKKKVMKPIGLFFSLLAQRTAKQLSAERNRNNAILVAISILILFSFMSSVFLYFLMKRRILHPVELLEVGAHQVQNGVYTYKVEYSEEDEFGELSSAFNLMADSVFSTTEELSLKESELKKAQERLELSVAGSGDALWEYNNDTKVNWFSDRFIEILGYEEGELPLTLATWQAHVHPDDLNAAFDAFTLHLQSDVLYDIEYRLRSKNGEYRWYRARAKSLRDKSGRAYRTSGSISDITDRVKIELEIKESEEKLLSMLSNIPGAVYRCQADSDFTMLFISDEIKKITGYPPADFIGESPVLKLADLIDPADMETIMLEVVKCIENHTAHTVEYRLKDSEGSIHHLLTHGQAIYDDSGTPLFVDGSIFDITHKHEAEVELLKAKEAAEAATEAKGNFLANMSHEIRTPMNAIIGLGYLALQTDLTRKQYDYLTKISSSANNLLGIINDILDFSKIEAGKIDMESIDFDLAETLDNFSNVVVVKAEEKGLELLINMDPEVPMGLKGDPLRLNQILINLTNNAVKFTSYGEVSIAIDVVNKDEENVCLHFAIKDSGIGMTDEQMKKLFQAFSQADDSTSRKFGGTGLGLTISKKLVELMGGEIGVESISGEGSTFFFTANFGIGVVPQHREPRTLPDDLKDIRVLIVDDNETSRTILARYLESFGFVTGEVASGEDALEELEQADMPYKLVLMDWKMPGMNGLETTQLIHANESIKEIPKVLMVTAYGRDELKEEAEDIGIDAFLVKPVNPSTLLNAILEAFNHEVVHRKSINKIYVADHLRGAKILVVEDNEINQQVAEELLRQEGIEVVIADNGKVAVSTLNANPDAYDAILMDIQMPIMDGYTATETIRKDERFEELPIIAMTANAMEKDRILAKNAGMNDHIAKPIDVKQMFEILAKWVHVPEARRPTSAHPHDNNDVEPMVPMLDGIDMEKGLRHLAGNTKLYLKILNKFKNNQVDAVSRIQAAIDDNDYETAEREVHTLKGLAGNIGATNLQKTAGKVEAQAHDKSILNLDELAEQLVNVINSLQQLETVLPRKQSTIVAADPVVIKTLMSELRDLLEDDDSEATDVLDKLLPMIRGGSEEQALLKVASLVDDYEFDDALNALNEMGV